MCMYRRQQVRFPGCVYRYRVCVSIFDFKCGVYRYSLRLGLFAKSLFIGRKKRLKIKEGEVRNRVTGRGNI